MVDVRSVTEHQLVVYIRMLLLHSDKFETKISLALANEHAYSNEHIMSVILKDYYPL